MTPLVFTTSLSELLVRVVCLTAIYAPGKRPARGAMLGVFGIWLDRASSGRGGLA